MSARTWVTAAIFVAFAGCTFPVREDVDELVCRRSTTPFDALPAREHTRRDDPQSDLILTSAQEPKKPKTIQDRLPVNQDIPGADVPPIVIPRVAKDEYRTMIDKVIRQY